MRDLDEIRVDIDKIDKELRELIMKRLECSREVVESKIENKSFVIYKADREEAILDKLGADVTDEKKPVYLPLVRKMTEMSRMFQYGILFEREPQLFEALVKDITIPENASSVTIILERPNIPNAMSSILSMVGDYGFNMDQMNLIQYSKDNSSVKFELTILGNMNDINMKKLMLQLSMESTGFKIVDIN